MEMHFKSHIRESGTRKIGTGFYGRAMININELRVLRHRVRFISQRLELIKKRVETPEIKPDQGVIAVVDREECAGCGICYDVCPEGAIAIDITARIDSRKCTACLECVNRCPRGAIAIKYKSH
jgi:ferredoxin